MKKILCLLLVLPVFFSCGPSIKLSQSWVAPGVTHPKFDKVVVLVLGPAKYSSAGHVGEQQLAAELKANGVNAVSAQDEYGPQAFRNGDGQGVLAKLKKSGADAVILTSLLDEEKEKRWVPGTDFPPPYYGRFWGYYSFWYARAYNPGYYEATRKYYFETNLYDLSNSNLLYSVQSETVDPGSAEQLARVFSKRVLKDMKAKQMI